MLVERSGFPHFGMLFFQRLQPDFRSYREPAARRECTGLNELLKGAWCRATQLVDSANALHDPAGSAFVLERK